MSMYWVYDLPTWLFGVLTTTAAVAIGLAGLQVTRQWARRVHREQHSHNEIVGFYLGAVCLFYGITLGLLAVGAWQTYSDVGTKVDQEASALAVVYRIVSNLPEPKRTELQNDLREYTREVIDVAWPLQRRGIVPQSTTGALNTIQNHLAGFEPVTESQKTLHAEAYRVFDRMVELRRLRLRNVGAGLPTPLWSVVLVGGLLNIALTWFFDLRSQTMHVWMTVMFAGFVGLLIFQLAAMDQPFRGEISVGPDAFELVYEQTMKPAT
ncbi:MAG: DUF4239 domain-containing protein [Verrucomicrobia bacterium]|nr:DUF4239 domain-containing protein [Verrucomicrobiota bacterium]